MKQINLLNIKLKAIIFVVFFFNSFFLEAKILIITHAFNRPDFIEFQHSTFEKFLQDDYEFVVFNDATNTKHKQQIAKTCETLDIPCIRIPQSIHAAPYLPREKGDDFQNPSIRTANVIQYSLDVMGFDHDGIVMIIDSDMFLIKDFSISEYMREHDLAAVPQRRESLHYIWNGLVICNMNTLPDKRSLNFNCKKINSILLDTGGETYYYLIQHPELKFARIDNEYINQWDFLTPTQMTSQAARILYKLHFANFEFLLNYTFLHYRSGGNWDNRLETYHKSKTEILIDFMKTIL